MKRFLACLLIAASVALALPASADAPAAIPGATTVDAQRVIALINETPNLVIVDNRRAEDFNRGHIEGSIRILDTEMTEAALSQHARARNQPVLFYCNGPACGRAAKAAEMAVAWGYTSVYYYALGMDEWNRLNLPVVR